jgi:DNA-binding transcriptional MerR regulator
MNGLKIAEAAKIIGCHPNSLRRYERRGIIPMARRHPGCGWRIYSPKDVEVIQHILNGEAT